MLNRVFALFDSEACEIKVQIFFFLDSGSFLHSDIQLYGSVFASAKDTERLQANRGKTRVGLGGIK